MADIPFVERAYELDGQPLIVRFDTPTRAPTGEFTCRWFIGWPAGDVSRKVHGEDGVQALMLAMRSVNTELRDSEAYLGGRLKLWDQTDLDLPPSWGVGPLYDVPARD